MLKVYLSMFLLHRCSVCSGRPTVNLHWAQLGDVIVRSSPALGDKYVLYFEAGFQKITSLPRVMKIFTFMMYARNDFGPSSMMFFSQAGSVILSEPEKRKFWVGS